MYHLVPKNISETKKVKELETIEPMYNKMPWICSETRIEYVLSNKLIILQRLNIFWVN